MGLEIMFEEKDRRCFLEYWNAKTLGEKAEIAGLWARGKQRKEGLVMRRKASPPPESSKKRGKSLI